MHFSHRRGSDRENGFFKANGRYLFFIAVILAMFGYLVWGLAGLQLVDPEAHLAKVAQNKQIKIPATGKRGTITDYNGLNLAYDVPIYNVTFYRDGSQTGTAFRLFTKAISETIDIIEENGGEVLGSFPIRRKPPEEDPVDTTVEGAAGETAQGDEGSTTDTPQDAGEEPTSEPVEGVADTDETAGVEDDDPDTQLPTIKDEGGDGSQEEEAPWEYYFGSLGGGITEKTLTSRHKQWRSNNYLTNSKFEDPYVALMQLKGRYYIFTDFEEDRANIIKALAAAFVMEDNEAYENGEISEADKRNEDARTKQATALIDAGHYADIISIVHEYNTGTFMSEEKMLKVMGVQSLMQDSLFNSQPVIIATDVTTTTMLAVETRAMEFNNCMQIAIGTKRVYPRQNLASQLIGYTGKIQSAEQYYNELKPRGYAMNDFIGINGIENSMEDYLTPNTSDRRGYTEVERDRSGRITRVIDSQAPVDGNNVKLTIRADYQQEAERAIAANVERTNAAQAKKIVDSKWLEKYTEKLRTRNLEKQPLNQAQHGALVVVNMVGQVYAMASTPTYDLNKLIAGGEYAEEIFDDPRGLTLNYATQARGAPGSIFKMVTGFAALQEGVITTETLISDQGKFVSHIDPNLRTPLAISNAPQCWVGLRSVSKHKDLNIVNGIQRSCNYFFYEIGYGLFNKDSTKLTEYATKFGLSGRTNIELPYEARSVVASQNALYNKDNPVGEATQDSSKAIIVFNSIKSHLVGFGARRGIVYDSDRLNKCIKRMMDMAIDTPQSSWTERMRAILMEELNMTQQMVNLAEVITDPYNYLNDMTWGAGESIMMAIGQSVTQVTPISVARYVAAVANGGKVYDMTIIDSITSPEGEIISQKTPQLYQDLNDVNGYLSYIRKGMEGVVDDGGTASKVFDGWKYLEHLSAKTGTAQNSNIDIENHAWFVSFVPRENPEIAIASFIPYGWSGAESAYATKDWLTWYFQNKESSQETSPMPGGNQLSP